MNASTPGQRLARGVCRHFGNLDFASLVEFSPVRGLRVDVFAVGPKGEIWIVECKSGRADFLADSKWHHYLAWCDRFFWAVDSRFDVEILPPDSGLIIADAYDAEIIRAPVETLLAGTRRAALIRKFARNAAERLRQRNDPAPGRRRLISDQFFA